MSADTDIRILILGTGGMAGQHAGHFRAVEGVELVAGVDLDRTRVEAFCDQYGIANRFTDLDAAIQWGGFDAVANVTPDKMHHATTLQVLAAGKHVFCEKPLTTNHAHALEMTEAARAADRVAMVNLSYRNVPGLQKARQMVEAGEIGEIRHVEASYLQSWLSSRHAGDWRTESRWLWRLSRDHGSNGVLGDVGTHILDFAIFGAASDIKDMDCRLKAFQKATGDRVGEYKLDANDSFVMSVEFANGALGTIHGTRWASGYSNTLQLRLFGTTGALELDYRGKDANGQPISSLRACLGEDLVTQKWQTIATEEVETTYQRFIRALRLGETLEPSFAHATTLQMILDQALTTTPVEIARPSPGPELLRLAEPDPEG